MISERILYLYQNHLSLSLIFHLEHYAEQTQTQTLPHKKSEAVLLPGVSTLW